MKDRIAPCVYYTCAHGICRKGFCDVTLAKCKNCRKYKGRKLKQKPLPVRLRREREKLRTDP